MKDIQVEIRTTSFDPWQELMCWGGEPAAVAVFVGRVRPTTMDGRSLQALELEHYPGLCERQIATMAKRLQRQHGAGAVLVLHRVGLLYPSEPIVLVAVESDRRGTAQRCSVELLEELKHRAPFWKKEWCNDQGTWLVENTPL